MAFRAGSSSQCNNFVRGASCAMAVFVAARQRFGLAIAALCSFIDAARALEAPGRRE